VRESPKSNRTLRGIRVGHATDLRGLTGVTVILCGRGAPCAVDVRGGAAGTRDLETCRPGHIAEQAHGILLTGGSAFGLDAAAGVMTYLESRGVGFRAGRSRVPIVPAACIFDLNVGRASARPGAAMAMRACRAAAGEGGRLVREGSVGAGTGATVGKINGVACSTKGGVGFYSVQLPGPGAEAARRGGGVAELGGRARWDRGELGGGIIVQALAVVNAFGDVLNPSNGNILAGARRGPRSAEFVGTTGRMLQGIEGKGFVNTTLVVIITDAALDKIQLTQVTQMTHNGFARAISPVHTRFDGDLVFALSTGRKRADLDAIGTAAAEVAAQAIVRAVKCAQGLGGVPSWQDLARMRS
jgi:L-aminopeptidase/D-esterase-like protein